MKTALLLIALGWGFKIYADASSMGKKSVKRLGRMVGIVIMVISFLGALCTTIGAMKYGYGDGYYYHGMGGHWDKSNCPFTGWMHPATGEMPSQS